MLRNLQDMSLTMSKSSRTPRTLSQPLVTHRHLSLAIVRMWVRTRSWNRLKRPWRLTRALSEPDSTNIKGIGKKCSRHSSKKSRISWVEEAQKIVL